MLGAVTNTVADGAGLSIIDWAVIGGVITILGFLLTLGRYVYNLATEITTIKETANRANERVDENRTQIKQVDAVAALALGKFEIMGTEFHNHRVDIGRQVAIIETKADNVVNTVNGTENRLAGALDRFSDQIVKLGQRIDSLHDSRALG